MKRKKASFIAEGFDSEQPEFLCFCGIWPIFVLLVLAALCISAVAQEKTANDYFKQGRELLGNGSKDEGIQALNKALQIYNESIKQNPNDTNAWLGKGNVLAIRELSGTNLSAINGSPSLAAYDEVLKIEPKNVDALIAKGFVLFEMGFADKENHNRSLDTLDKAIKIDPKSQLPGISKALYSS